MNSSGDSLPASSPQELIHRDGEQQDDGTYAILKPNPAVYAADQVRRIKMPSPSSSVFTLRFHLRAELGASAPTTKLFAALKLGKDEHTSRERLAARQRCPYNQNRVAHGLQTDCL